MDKARSISKSMIAYLKRARDQKEFLLKETVQYERGKRHLANIMGIDEKEMTQNHIDDAIKYLFPSGLFEPLARPIMKHPDVLFRAQKEAQFDETGRPHHYLFYTGKPQYREALSKISQKLRELDAYEDEKLSNGVLDPPEDASFVFHGKKWLDVHAVCDKFLEKIHDHEYSYLIRCLERVREHPYSKQASDILEDFSQQLPEERVQLKLPEIKRDESTGMMYTELQEMRREHVMKIKTTLTGSGKIDIEGFDILYFDEPYLRRAIYSPIAIANMLDKVDIHARFIRAPGKIGQTAVAGCIRHALSMSLAAYMGPEVVERLRLAGYMSTDTRRKERKKYGQAKARRKYTWKRR